MSDVLLKVKFTRGTHPSERKFWIPAPGGGHYTGLADVSHCYNLKQSQLAPADLGDDQEDGFLAAVVVSSKSGRLRVSVPDGGVCEVEQTIALKPSTAYVPV